MATVQAAKRVRWIGYLVTVIGSSVCLVLWLAFQMARAGRFLFISIIVGSTIQLIGMILQRSAKQPNVGRQM